MRALRRAYKINIEKNFNGTNAIHTVFLSDSFIRLAIFSQALLGRWDRVYCSCATEENVGTTASYSSPVSSAK